MGQDYFNTFTNLLLHLKMIHLEGNDSRDTQKFVTEENLQRLQEAHNLIELVTREGGQEAGDGDDRKEEPKKPKPSQRPLTVKEKIDKFADELPEDGFDTVDIIEKISRRQ